MAFEPLVICAGGACSARGGTTDADGICSNDGSCAESTLSRLLAAGEGRNDKGECALAIARFRDGLSQLSF